MTCFLYASGGNQIGLCDVLRIYLNPRLEVSLDYAYVSIHILDFLKQSVVSFHLMSTSGGSSLSSLHCKTTTA